MKLENKIVEAFFLEMKEKDSQLTIPLAPKMANLRKKRILYFAVAASFLMLLSFFVLINKRKEASYFTVEIVFVETEKSSSQSLINQISSFDTWQSPTQSLSEDF